MNFVAALSLTHLCFTSMSFFSHPLNVRQYLCTFPFFFFFFFFLLPFSHLVSHQRTLYYSYKEFLQIRFADNCLARSMIVSEYILFLTRCNNVMDNIGEKDKETRKFNLRFWKIWYVLLRQVWLKITNYEIFIN